MLTLREQKELERLRAQDQREIKALKKELQRKAKAMAEIAALLVQQKKWEACCSEDAEAVQRSTPAEDDRAARRGE